MGPNLLSKNHYVLDTGFFVTSRAYYPGNFPSFWKKMEKAVSYGTISSVKEVMKELKRYEGDQEHLLDWIKIHKQIFTNPSPEEQKKTRQILAVPEFQGLVAKKNRIKGSPAADPFIIAKAWNSGAIVVTKEKLAPRNKTPRIPDVCKHFGVQCITPEAFMENEGWTF